MRHCNLCFVCFTLLICPPCIWCNLVDQKDATLLRLCWFDHLSNLTKQPKYTHILMMLFCSLIIWSRSPRTSDNRGFSFSSTLHILTVFSDLHWMVFGCLVLKKERPFLRCFRFHWFHSRVVLIQQICICNSSSIADCLSTFRLE